MKKIMCLLIVAVLLINPFVFAKEKKESVKENPRITNLESVRKKKGSDDLASRAKNASNVAQLKQIVLELIEMTTGGK